MALIITLSQLKSDIAGKMRGTSIKEVKDFYGTVASAANRMLSRIDTQETIRIQTMASPFFDNVNDYSLVSDFKRGIDIRPQANRMSQPGRSIYSETTPRQFLTRLDANSFSVKWNNMTRSLRAQRLNSGNVVTMDTFDVTMSGTSAVTSGGTWTANGDASGLYAEVLNYVEGNGSMGFNLSGSIGAAYLEDLTGPVTDLSANRYEDSSFLYFYIPVGYSASFTSFNLSRGSSSSAYKRASTTTKVDGTAFTDGWNFLRFDWGTATTTGVPDDTKNTYRRFGIATVAGTAIPNCLIDNWTNSIGELYEMEYYSEYMFRTAAGVWIQSPTLDTDLVNVGITSYEILKAEIMIEITMQIRIGNMRTEELSEWGKMLNGDNASRYIKDPKNQGLYSTYGLKFPSSAIVTATSTYTFDV
jgi:hypothetical protein